MEKERKRATLSDAEKERDRKRFVEMEKEKRNNVPQFLRTLEKEKGGSGERLERKLSLSIPGTPETPRSHLSKDEDPGGEDEIGSDLFPIIMHTGKPVNYSRVKFDLLNVAHINCFMTDVVRFEREECKIWDRRFIHEDIHGVLDIRWHKWALRSALDRDWRNCTTARFLIFLESVRDLCNTSGKKSLPTNDPLLKVVEILRNLKSKLYWENASASIEVMWGRIAKQAVLVDIHTAEKHDLEKLRIAIRDALVPGSDTKQNLKLVKEILKFGPDYGTYFERPPTGDSIKTWFFAMSAKAESIAKAGFDILEFLPDLQKENEKILPRGGGGGGGERGGRGERFPQPITRERDRDNDRDYRRPKESRRDSDPGKDTKQQPPYEPSKNTSDPGKDTRQQSPYEPSRNARRWESPGKPQAGQSDKPDGYNTCQACGRKNSYHKEADCKALLLKHPFANPNFKTMSWRDSPQGKIAIGLGYDFFELPKGKGDYISHNDSTFFNMSCIFEKEKLVDKEFTKKELAIKTKRNISFADRIDEKQYNSSDEDSSDDEYQNNYIVDK